MLSVESRWLFKLTFPLKYVDASVHFGSSIRLNVKMFWTKRFYILASILAVACAIVSDSNNGFDTNRSAVCLIYRVAQHNHVNATFTKVNIEQRNGTTNIECKLNLGNEEYSRDSTSFAKAKEKVAREAYAKTKYTKPAIQNKTCLIPVHSVKNDISLLQEYANVVNKTIRYEEIPQASKCKFEYLVSIDGQSASAISDVKKKEAKRLAAARLIDQIGRESIINALSAKFNATDYHSMEPTQRLRKIVQVTDLSDDAVYTKREETMERKGGKTVKRIVMQVEAKSSMAAGSGTTIEEATSAAAANLLRHLGFVVNYPPKAQN